MRNLHWRLALLAIAAGGISACGGGGSNTPVTPPVTVTPAAKLEDQFGANFGVAYRNNPNTEAMDPKPGDIGPLSLTTEPVTI